MIDDGLACVFFVDTYAFNCDFDNLTSYYSKKKQFSNIYIMLCHVAILVSNRH